MARRCPRQRSAEAHSSGHHRVRSRECNRRGSSLQTGSCHRAWPLRGRHRGWAAAPEGYPPPGSSTHCTRANRRQRRPGSDHALNQTSGAAPGPHDRLPCRALTPSIWPARSPLSCLSCSKISGETAAAVPTPRARVRPSPPASLRRSRWTMRCEPPDTHFALRPDGHLPGRAWSTTATPRSTRSAVASARARSPSWQTPRRPVLEAAAARPWGRSRSDERGHRVRTVVSDRRRLDRTLGAGAPAVICAIC